LKAGIQATIPDGAGQRLLTFEIGAAVYALPIADVLEVAEVPRTACIPTLPRLVAGVVNHHGDALPVISREAVFELSTEVLPEPQHLLVVGERPVDAGRLGLPVDRVLGLADGPVAGRATELVAQRRPIDGRVVHILSTSHLLARASQAIERAVDRASGRIGPGQGGL
jgi:chemotaxis protein histidine kinase CheA